MRLLIYRALRAECGGADNCADADDAKCHECGHIWQADDIVFARCPVCSERNFRMLPCADCKVEAVNRVRSCSLAGQLFDRALRLDFDTEHLSVPWSDVSAEEVTALQILKAERGRYQLEQAKSEEMKQRGFNGVHS